MDAIQDKLKPIRAKLDKIPVLQEAEVGSKALVFLEPRDEAAQRSVVRTTCPCYLVCLTMESFVTSALAQ